MSGHADVYMTRVDRLPLAELGAVGDYLLACRDRGMRPRTILAKHRLLRGLQDQLGPLEAAPEDQLRTWWRQLAGRGLTNATRAVYLSHVRAFYTWAARERLVTLDPTVRIDRPRSTRSVPRDLDPRRVAELLHTLAGREWLVVALMATAGLRCCEVAVAHSSQVRHRQDGSHVMVVTGKGGHSRTVPLSHQLGESLLAWDGWVFPSTRLDREHVAAEHVSRWTAELLRRQGLDATAHQLRHTYATLVYAASRDVFGLQATLGHTSSATTQRYVTANTSGMAQVVEHLYANAG